MIKPKNKKYPTIIYLSSLLSLSLSLSLSHSHAILSECEVCINQGGHLPNYTNQVTSLLHDGLNLFH